MKKKKENIGIAKEEETCAREKGALEKTLTRKEMLSEGT
jgi:hypothetical protein